MPSPSGWSLPAPPVPAPREPDARPGNAQRPDSQDSSQGTAGTGRRKVLHPPISPEKLFMDPRR